MINFSDKQNISILQGSKQAVNDLTLVQTVRLDFKVDSIAPGDFNGDEFVDILLMNARGKIFICLFPYTIMLMVL